MIARSALGTASAAARIGALFPSLAGLPSAERKRRLVLPLGAYIDDSGSGDPPVFVLAGFIARAERWLDFNDRWREALDGPPHIKYFKMKDAFALTNEFLGWDAPSRDRLIHRLVKIISDTALFGFANIVYHEDYRAAFRGKITKQMDSPYWLMYHFTIRIVLRCLLEREIDEPVSLVFDEQNAQTDQVQAVWSLFLRELPDRERRLLAGRPDHRSEMEALPLQAADLLAWHIRRSYEEYERGATFSAPYMEDLDRIPFSDHLAQPSDLQQFRARVARFNRQIGRVTPYQMAELQRRLPETISQHNLRLIGTARPNSSVLLTRFPAKGMKRFLLVHSCPLSDSPHLHRRSGDRCLLETQPSD